MPLDPQAEAFLAKLDELGAPRYGEQPTPLSRRLMEDGAAELFGPLDPVPFEERTIPGQHGAIPVRVYHPIERARGALVYFHGGGWVLGSAKTIHGVCSTLARVSECVVVSVDYRLAPEHPFPAAVDDAWSATTWVSANREELGVDGPIAVGGESAGGNLAAVVALRARDSMLPIAFQLLVYPVTDAALDTPSYEENAHGYWLTRNGMVWFWDQYVPTGDRFNPDASPLRAKDLSGVAPAHVITAEYDPLRDEGEAYAERLAEAGVPVTFKRYDGLIHGFFRLPGVIDRANGALEAAAAAVRSAVLDAGTRAEA